MRINIKQTKIFKIFSSIKLAIGLLSIIAAFSVIGTLTPDRDIYSAWWFIGILGLLAVNLIFCLSKRFSLKSKSLGTTLSHVSILVILAGALVGMVYGQKADIRIVEGHSVNTILAKNRRIPLGFSLRLDDFIYQEHIDPEEKVLVYSKDGQLLTEVSAQAGSQADIADTGYAVKALRYVPDFVMDMRTKEVTSRSAEPKNPAVQIELEGKDGVKKSWVFAGCPDMHRAEESEFTFRYQWKPRRAKDYVSKVTVIKDNKEVAKADIRVNHPLRFEGYAFFQSTYDSERLLWAGLQVVKDPGVPVVYIGFTFLIIGLIIRFYINPLIR